MTQTAAEVYRDYETTGVPASGPHKPIKAEIRALLGMYESLFGSVGLGYATRALLYADLNHAANTLAIVYADPNPAYNGIYQKSGASGSGSWARVGDTPNDVIRLTESKRMSAFNQLLAEIYGDHRVDKIDGPIQ